MIRAAVFFYGLMGGLGLLLIMWRPAHRHLFQPWAMPGSDWPLWICATAALVICVNLLTRLGLRYSSWLRRISADVVDGFGHLDTTKLLTLAVLSGICEELLFRGWLLNEVGLVASSIIFGAVHIPPARHWIAWPIFAAVLGFLLGAMCIESGTLVFAILAHAGINGANLALLMSRNRRVAVNLRAGPEIP